MSFDRLTALRLKVGIGVSASLPAVILMMLAVTAAPAPAAAVVSGRMAAPAAAAAVVVPLLPCRGRPGLLGRGRLRDWLAAGRGPAALGAAVLVTRHLAHLDEAAVEARQVLQGAVVLHALISSLEGDREGGVGASYRYVKKVEG